MTPLSNASAPTVIGLGGHLRAGKDAVADHLVSKHSYTKLGMSDVLLEAAEQLNPIVYVDARLGPIRLAEHVQAVGYVEAKRNPEVRRTLQALGTDVGRNMIGENVWVDMVQRRIRTHLEHGRSVVVTGIRFRNELDMVAAFTPGLTAWVDRPSVPRPVGGHISEHSLLSSDFEWGIANHGTLEELYLQVDDIAGLASVQVPAGRQRYTGPKIPR